jgi:hypothetical protein
MLCDNKFSALFSKQWKFKLCDNLVLFSNCFDKSPDQPLHLFFTIYETRENGPETNPGVAKQRAPPPPRYLTGNNLEWKILTETSPTLTSEAQVEFLFT